MTETNCHELSDDCPCGPRSEPVSAADPSAHHMMSVTRQWCLACGAEAVDGALPPMPCPGITGAVEKDDDMPGANAEAIITNIRDEIRELRREGSVKTGGTYADLADLLETLLEPAPAGLPLHESADRDADNVPSDRVRAYAEAATRWMSFPSQAEHVARAVMAVADREQAELRAEVEHAKAYIERIAKTVGDTGNVILSYLSERVAKVVAERDALRADHERQAKLIRAMHDGDAALRGPEPTEATSNEDAPGLDVGADAPTPVGAEPTDERHTAALLESARQQTLDVSKYAADVDARRQELWRENEDLKTTIVRVVTLPGAWESLAEEHDRRGRDAFEMGDVSTSIANAAMVSPYRGAARDLRAVLRGPDPTDAP